jgi:hypothetical protein
MMNRAEPTETEYESGKIRNAGVITGDALSLPVPIYREAI